MITEYISTESIDIDEKQPWKTVAIDNLNAKQVEHEQVRIDEYSGKLYPILVINPDREVSITMQRYKKKFSIFTYL